MTSLLDELMANAWPPGEEERHGGWRLRWAGGFTRRANSVLAMGQDGDVGVLVATAETFYRARRAPARFLVSSASAPPRLAPYLAQHGYRPGHRTVMMTSPTSAVAHAPAIGTWPVSVGPELEDNWFQSYWSVQGGRGRRPEDAAMARAILAAGTLPKVFVSVYGDNAVVATGQGVLEAGWCGVQGIGTGPRYRGGGAATAVMTALASSADQHGAGHLYLAVQADNGPAVALYQRCGFVPAHEYEYWEPAVLK